MEHAKDKGSWIGDIRRCRMATGRSAMQVLERYPLSDSTRATYLSMSNLRSRPLAIIQRTFP